MVKVGVRRRKRGRVGSVVTPDTVRQQQVAVSADYQLVKAAVLDGNAKGVLSDAVLEEWDSLATRVTAYLALDPSWLSTATQADQGDALRQELASWHGKLSALGVPIGAAPVLPAAPGPGLFAGLSQLGSSPVLLLLLGVLLVHEMKGKF